MKTKINKFFSLIIIFSMVFCNIGFFVFPLQVSAAAALTQVTATPSDVTAGNTASYTITFKTTATIANTGKVTLQFPDGFNVSGASFTSWTGFDGAQTLAVAGQVITITRTSGASSAAGVKTIVLGDIVNTSTLANNYQVIVTTKNAANTVLNGPTSSIYFQIFASHSETEIEGPYYLRSGAQTHYQYSGGAGSGYDLGTLSAIAPTSDEERYCGGWVQFYFDENGTYTQTNQITNIYYHAWWDTGNNQGTLGYEKTGAYTPTATEGFAVNSANSTNKVGGYSLYAGKQTLATPQDFLGNSIYNLSMILYSSNQAPTIISSPEQSSFVIFNLPDNIDTLGLSQDGDTDYDDDGAADYDELFTHYTNPYNSDTDDDGWDDQYELDNTLNPLDPDSAPVPNGFMKYEGGAANDRFGQSVSSISDIDGDGLDDVLVGASVADPGGLSSAGSAYIYSSSTGNLIRQYNGVAANDFFGQSVSSISDIDGDGLDDVLVGAPSASPGGLAAAGSAYIYSSSTGNLIRQYNGVAASDFFGQSVSSISDIDGDGLDDVLVGAPYASPGGVLMAGSAYIYSSSTGNLIRQFNGTASMDCLGFSVSSIADIEGDDLEDVVIGASLASPGGLAYAGSAYIYSSSTGNLIRQYNGLSANESFGSAVSSIADIDGDGLEDVLLAANNATQGIKINLGYTRLYSSVTGNLIWQYEGLISKDFFGSSISSIGDRDGDGLDDILVGAKSSYSASYASIYSSDTGELLKRYDGEMIRDYFGCAVSAISDLDGDGLDDVLVGAYGADPDNLSSAGSVYIYYSGNDVINQTWSKGTNKSSAFDLDNYFKELNNSTVPARNQTITYTASTDDNEYIDVTIDEDNRVSFTQPAEWSGTEEVVFTATDSTGLSSNSNTVTLTVSGDSEMNTPDIAVPVADSPSSITWKWVDNSEIEESYSVDYDNDGGGTASGVSDLYSQSSKSSSGSNLTWTDEDLSPNTEYSVSVKAHRNDIGFSDSSVVSDSVYTLVESPTHFSASIDSDDILLSAERFANDNEGLSGYYFENTTNGNNSGWINDNFWQDNGLENSTEYTYSVRYRNGDGVETDPVVLGATTSFVEEDTEDTIDDSNQENSTSNNTNYSQGYSLINLETEQEDIDSEDEDVDLELASQDSNVSGSDLDNSTNKKNWTWVFVIISIVVAGSIGFIILRIRKAK